MHKDGLMDRAIDHCESELQKIRAGKGKSGYAG